MKFVLVALVVLVGSVGYAADGRIEINQSVVDAAGGAPFTITQSGSYVLTGNLVVGSGNSAAIVVNAPNVVVDLNGFTLQGDVVCPGEPPVCSSGGPIGVSGASQNTTVRNGNIVGMSTAVSLGDNGARVEDLTISQCNLGISAAGTGGSFVARNLIIDTRIGGFISDGLVRDNTLRNVNFGLSVDPDGGYVDNVVIDAPSASAGISGGVPLGHNLCNGQRCSSLRRRFYLSKNLVDGSQALGACAAGFHMASMWEIHDPSNLDYDTQLGFTNGDTGQGPPTTHVFDEGGWIRTGSNFGQHGLVGGHSCYSWTSTVDLGTVLTLKRDWGTASIGVSPWLAANRLCSESTRVWCVED